jgi:hypothetical protein
MSETILEIIQQGAGYRAVDGGLAAAEMSFSVGEGDLHG